MPLANKICVSLLSMFVLLVVTANAGAESVLDRLRATDLNDYALGMAYSVTQNPYAGTANSTLVYPYLTSFEHSAFTDNWLLIRGENFGLRVVTEKQWEYGLIARVQTLGPGVANNDQLVGIGERGWALESGPLIGWRGSPVNIQFRSYWDLPNRHSGTTSELEFSLPLKFPRGFFVPAIKLTHLSKDYSGHYFSVSAQESTPQRPAYQPGAANNLWAGFALGYELAPRWLLKTSIGVEFLDDTIVDSPIVSRDRQWSASLGLAYNADLFLPRGYQGPLREQGIEIRLGSFSSLTNTTVQRNTDGGQSGDPVDIEDLLGVADRQTVFQIDARIRNGYYHQFELGYFRTQRRSTTTLDQDLIFGDLALGAGTDVETRLESSLLRFSYAYSLLRDTQKEFAVKAGISYVQFDSRLAEVDSQQSERLSAEAPLPTVGALGAIALNEDWRLAADLNLFALDFDRYSGFMGFLSVDLQRQLGDFLSAGVGYNFYTLNLTAKDQDLGGKLKLRQHGPKLFFSVGF